MLAGNHKLWRSGGWLALVCLIGLLVTACSASHPGAQTQKEQLALQPYANNPVYSDPNNGFSKDPNVRYFGHTFYLYYFATSGPTESIDLATSADMIHWQYQGTVLHVGPGNSWDNALLWAPDVIRYGGRYLLYFAGGQFTASGQQNWATLRIGVAESAVPQGPFHVMANNPIVQPYDGEAAIDPDVVVYQNRFYLFYAVQQIRAGQWWEGIVEAEGTSPFHFVHPQLILSPSLSWQRNILEAPSVFAHDGRWYLLYSGGPSNGGQVIGYATASNISGPWTMWPSNAQAKPVLALSAQPSWAGNSLGSTSVVERGGNTYVFYQGLIGSSYFEIGYAEAQWR
jgi:beta-xylosidase